MDSTNIEQSADAMMKHYVDEMKKTIAIGISVLGGVDKMATIADVTARTVYAWKNGERFPSMNNLSKIAAHIKNNALRNSPECKGEHDGFVVQSDVAVYGSTPYEELRSVLVSLDSSENEKDFSPHHLGRNATSSNGFSQINTVFVPFLLEQESGEGEQLPFGCEYRWLHSLCSLPQRARWFTVQGRTMEMTLHHNDLCLVDTVDTLLSDDKIYVFSFENDIFLRRVCRKPGEILLRTDNRQLSHLDFSYKVNKKDTIKILGRIFWVGKTL